jgi:hypothetical protein
MRATLAVGEHTVHNAVDDAEEAAAPLRQLRLLVDDLDGDRHLRTILTAANGTVLARSTPLPSDESTPRWFFNLLGSKPLMTRIQPSPFGQIGVLILETDPHNEIGEVWSDAMPTLIVLTLFCSLIAILVFWSTGAALRPRAGRGKDCRSHPAGHENAQFVMMGMLRDVVNNSHIFAVAVPTRYTPGAPRRASKVGKISLLSGERIPEDTARDATGGMVLGTFRPCFKCPSKKRPSRFCSDEGLYCEKKPAVSAGCGLPDGVGSNCLRS